MGRAGEIELAIAVHVRTGNALRLWQEYSRPCEGCGAVGEEPIRAAGSASGEVRLAIPVKIARKRFEDASVAFRKGGKGRKSPAAVAVAYDHAGRRATFRKSEIGFAVEVEVGGCQEWRVTPAGGLQRARGERAVAIACKDGIATVPFHRQVHFSIQVPIRG